MANIESKNLLVWVKAMSRGQALPLDTSEIYESFAEAQSYASSAIAYAGQTIKAKLEDGKYHEYILQPSDSGYVLEEVGAISESDLKQYVVVVETLPESGQIEGVLYINTADNSGHVWTGAWKKVFWDVTTDITEVADRVTELEANIDTKAPINNPVFSGVVKVGEEEVALKSYVDGLFANLEESCATPEIVDATHPIPAKYKAGRTYRVAEDGAYAGVECEVGDLILVVKDYVEGSASNNDFMVLQANIDGAVTSTADVTTVGEIVVFDAVTGRVIKGSGVQIASLNDAIAKAHEHENKTVLDSYDKTQPELLETAKEEAQSLVGGLSESVNGALGNKADKGTTLADYGITDAYNKTEIDAPLKTIADNLNGKISGADVDDKISAAKEETLEDAATAASEALEERIGGIPVDTSIKSYIDTAIGSGGVSSAEAIAAAKNEAISTASDDATSKANKALGDAKAYTDEKVGGLEAKIGDGFVEITNAEIDAMFA